MKLVIFDCDGTIVDSQHAISAAMESAFSTHGLIAPERSRIVEVVGLSLARAVRELLPEADEALVGRVADTYKDAFGNLRRQAAHQEPLFPLAAETLRSLAEQPDVLLGIATGKSRRGVDAILEREGFHGMFVTIQTADDNPSKPHPGMVLQAMAETGVAPESTVMIGDTTYDIEMALNARAKALGVSWGYHPREALVRCGAHAMVASYAELPSALNGLIGVEIAA